LNYSEFDCDGRKLVNINGCLKDGTIFTQMQCPTERNIVSRQLHKNIVVGGKMRPMFKINNCVSYKYKNMHKNMHKRYIPNQILSIDHAKEI